jgi:RNA polymerase sigma-70 factor (ECF subfamily)
VITAAAAVQRRVETVDPLLELTNAAADGDRDAAEALVRATQGDVWRLARSLVGPDRAEDVAQDAYLRAWRTLAVRRPTTNPRSWLLGITWRASMDELRRRHRHQRRVDRASGERAPAPAVIEDTSLTAELLERLDIERRAAFVLTQLLGYSYADAAAVCNVPVGTIRSRVARARAELAAALPRMTGSDLHARG